jgi:uncharacterized membrane protein YeaQ/YmgE (transglycosylase-associated protein family)
MGILSWILVGLVAGWAADEMMRGDSYGILGNMLIGIVGAILGGFIASSLFGAADPLSGFNITTLIVAFLGSVVLLLILGLFRRRSRI